MDEAEKMILTSIQDDMKRLYDDTNDINNKILYLCSETKCTNQRLESIEVFISNSSKRLRSCETKVGKINTKIAMTAGFISLIIMIASPVISSLV